MSIESWLDETLPKLTRQQLINVMHEALDEMQQYNGRTRSFCIAVSLGCEFIDDETPKYRVPKLSEVKKNADNCRPVF